MATDIDESVKKRRLTPFETLALLAYAAYVVFELSIAVSPQPQGAYFGWNTASDGVTVTSLAPDGPAERAGIRVGDVVDWSSLPLLGRVNIALDQAAPAGAQLHVDLKRGETAFTRTMKAQNFEAPVQIGARIALIVTILVQIIGIVIVWLRPSNLTWAFLLGYGSIYITTFAPSSDADFLLHFGADAIVAGVSVAAQMRFISRFPRDYPRTALAWLNALAIPTAVIFAGTTLFLYVLVIVSSAPPPRWLLFTTQYLLGPALSVIALVALAISAYTARGSDRQRVLPVLLTIALWVIVSQVLGLYNESFTGGLWYEVLFFTQDAASLIFAAAVVNGIIRHRVIDISFTISRTLVYTILTSILVGTFALVDFVSSKLLEHLQITVILEAVAALSFGIALNTLHSRVEHFVDSFVFRRRHLAEQRLKRAARDMIHSDSERFIGEALVIEAMDALDLASAALFRRSGDHFARVLSEGWAQEDSLELPHDDHLVVRLTSELQAVDVSNLRWPNVAIPKGYARPLVAVPVAVRHELLGFALYGGHRGGEAIDPDERLALVQLADAAGPAYKHIRMEQLNRESAEWHIERTVLESERTLLRETIDALRAVSRSTS